MPRENFTMWKGLWDEVFLALLFYNFTTAFNNDWKLVIQFRQKRSRSSL